MAKAPPSSKNMGKAPLTRVIKSDQQNIKLSNPRMAEMIPPMSKDISIPPVNMTN
jgi:hypothetical protein